MAEKAEMAADTASLPPNYAPSEVFTDSAPPAYRREKSSRVQMVRLLCLTLVSTAFIIGFFVLASNYLRSRAVCVCPNQGEEVSQHHVVQKAQALVGLPSDDLLESRREEMQDSSNQLDEGDPAVMPPQPDQQQEEQQAEQDQLSQQELETLVEEVEEAERELEEAMEVEEEQEEQALQDILQAQVDHMKKIRLPVDLILGNPALAGRDVDCEVERRQHPLAPGVMAQAIIVTCRDDDDESGEQQLPQEEEMPMPPVQLLGSGPRQMGPPLSLIAPIMKMLSARAAASRGPRPNFMAPGSTPRCMPGPFPCMTGPTPKLVMLGPKSGPRPMPKSFPISGPEIEVRRLTPFRNPMPFKLPFPPQQEQRDEPTNRMLPIRLQPMVKVINQGPAGQPISLASLRRGALPFLPPPELKMIPHKMPEPQARALPSPINVPGLRLRPNRLLTPAFPFPRGGPNFEERRQELPPVTHMEMQHQAPKNNPEPVARDFGPPRMHTVLPNGLPMPFPPRPVPPVHMSKDILVHSSPSLKEVMTPPMPTAVLTNNNHPIAGHLPPPPPPPPSFAIEGKRGPMVPEINPDAEILPASHPEAPQAPVNPQPQSPPEPQEPKHHLLVVN